MQLALSALLQQPIKNNKESSKKDANDRKDDVSLHDRRWYERRHLGKRVVAEHFADILPLRCGEGPGWAGSRPGEPTQD